MYKNWNYLMEHRMFNVKNITSIEALPQSMVSMLSEMAIESDQLETRTSYFDRAIDINVQEDNEGRTVVQLEVGPVMLESGRVVTTHDYLLDVQAETFEQAVSLLVKKVKCHYGDDTESSILTVRSK